VLGAKYHKQLCVVSNPACRVPYEHRSPEAIKALHTPAPGKKHLPGHLKPFGHADFTSTWDGEIPTFKEGDMMKPDTFWNKYYPMEPFILKGAAKGDSAYKNWQSDEYIIKNFGHLKAKAENKNEDRLTDYCGLTKLGLKVDCPKTVEPYVETYINISRFMKNYLKPGYDKYIITQLPDAMADEVGVTPCWYCGSRHPKDKQFGYNHNNGKAGIMKGRPWMTQLYESNLWINYNSGKNFSSSVLHYDMNHQMMCLYAGKKEWILFDPTKYIDDIPMWSNYLQKGPGGYDGRAKGVNPPQGSDDSPIDPENVDLESFPQFAKARWRNTTMEAGDCMYLPAWHLHYVRSYGRNIAGMYMFQTGQKYDKESCKDAPMKTTPLGDFDILWNFPGAPQSAGHNQVKMGYIDWKKEFREPLAGLAQNGKIEKNSFVQWVTQHLGQGDADGQDQDDNDDGEEGGNSGASEMVSKQADKIFHNVAGAGATHLDVDLLYKSGKMAELFRTVAVNREGRPEQDMDSRIMRFDLAGNNKKVEEKDDL